MSATVTSPAFKVRADTPSLPRGMDPAYYALSLLRRRRLEDCIKVGTRHLTLPPAAAPAGSPTSPLRGSKAMDESIWFIQTKAMVQQSWYDDAGIEDDGVDDVLMEGEQAVVSTAHRPNTSLRSARQGTGAAGVGSRAGRLGSAAGAGRPVSSRYGYARPGTLQSRPGSARAGPGGTAVRPVTGRFIRLGTASLQSVPGGPHINVQALPLERYAREKPMVAKLLCDYLLYVEHKPKLALELCTAALKAAKPVPVQVPSSPLKGTGGAAAPGLPPKLPMGPGGMGLPPVLPMGPGPVPMPPRSPVGAAAVAAGTPPPAAPNAPSTVQEQVGITNANDWWWKARLAKANYQLGLLREAEKYLKAALFDPPSDAAGWSFMNQGGGRNSSSQTGATSTAFQRGRTFANYNTSVVMELGKVYLKMDQPLTALELYEAALQSNPVDHHVVLCCARLRDELHEPGTAYDLYNHVLHLNSSNIEAIACIGAHLFYEKNQPELALRYYRRLLQMGVHTAEVWTNMGLCAFYTFQAEVSLSCLSRALTLCKDDTQRADVWYNIGHVGIGMGNMNFAERAFRLAVGADATHAEALNNLAVLAFQKKKEKTGRRLLDTAVMAAPQLTEALYNTAVLSFEAGQLEVAQQMVMRVLEVDPDHPEAVVLRRKLRETFLAL
ncbi:putative tetratricopeptide repeat protein [Leptomonas pyrrhocoris]|uniref:Putative tetratricopeptide repeat protein n=1 Tax=Leptomonas pyrrhocoris TaxID=157538 RepID=A0A0N0DTJ9_LEPPY|nr:putative tetratricopeptide repeat protein [Leptomonas pyrrhocoris]KPA77534.1 putative tetratricopeptide repeat protein [Leptomonas pyrrhocoris]|eukprot:XP_015655973.1 putative tetratricopeptide repeat protein [Leptomonas pyrrhocoris]